MVLKFTSALLALYASVASAVNPLNVEGAYFVDSVTNDRFQVLGMAYQPGGSAGYNPGTHTDPLSHPEECLRDAIIMQGLGVNTLRVYNLDPLVDHDECVTIFDLAGIYLVLDVNSPLPNESLNDEEPWTSYHQVYLERVFQIVENFMYYDNLLGFFSANEVIRNMETGAITPQYIRAVTRDIKRYIARHAPRPIPVGYSAADVRAILIDSYNYLACSLEGDDENYSKIDFYGVNSYSWCGDDATFSTSGFDVMVRSLSQSTIPVFFSEYGCNEVDPRTWSEIPTIYGPQMDRVFSGGIVYEYTQEDNNYGIVDISGDTVQFLNDYNFLMREMNELDTSGLSTLNTTGANLQPVQCSPSLIEDSEFQSNFTIPASPPGVEDMIQDGVTGGFQGTQATSRDIDNQMPSQFTIENSSGRPVTGLELRILRRGQSNLPGNSSTSPSDGGPLTPTRGQNQPQDLASTSSGGDSEEGAAVSVRASSAMVALAFGLMCAALL